MVLRSQMHKERSIPAWAGEPICLRPSRRAPTVYPRVGGGTIMMACKTKWMDGLSPRGRGNLYSILV